MLQVIHDHLKPIHVVNFGGFAGTAPYLCLRELGALCCVARRARTEVRPLLQSQQEQIAAIWFSSEPWFELCWMSERYLDPVSLAFRHDIWAATPVHHPKEYLIKDLFATPTGTKTHMPVELHQLAAQILVPIFETRSCLSIPPVLTAYRDGTTLAQDLMILKFLEITNVAFTRDELAYIFFGHLTLCSLWNVDNLRTIQRVLHQRHKQFFHLEMLRDAHARIRKLIAFRNPE